MLGMDWYNGSQAQRIDQSWFANRTLGCIPGTPRSEFAGGTSNVVWAAVHNQFFTVVAMPEPPAPQVVGRKVYLPPPTREQMASESEGDAQSVRLRSGALSIRRCCSRPTRSSSGSSIFTPGPRNTTPWRGLPNNLDLVMGFGGFFGFFAKALLLSMNGLHALGLPTALAIIVITVIIKILFWPLTQRQHPIA